MHQPLPPEVGSQHTNAFRQPPGENLDERLARLLPLSTLEALRLLPKQMSLATLLHPPRALATRFGNIFALCFAHFNASLDSQCALTQETAALCLYFCPAMLLWKE